MSVAIALQSVVVAPKRAPQQRDQGGVILEHETTSLLLRRSMLEASAHGFSEAL